MENWTTPFSQLSTLQLHFSEADSLCYSFGVQHDCLGEMFKTKTTSVWCSSILTRQHNDLVSATTVKPKFSSLYSINFTTSICTVLYMICFWSTCKISILLAAVPGKLGTTFFAGVPSVHSSYRLPRCHSLFAFFAHEEEQFVHN